MTFSTFGRHAVLDAWGIDFDKLNDLDSLKKSMCVAAEACRANILSVQAQQFDPQGVTILVMLSESHLSIHTYPEQGFASLDCYTCGHTVDPAIAIKYMIAELNPTKINTKMLRRGVGSIDVVKSSFADKSYPEGIVVTV